MIKYDINNLTERFQYIYNKFKREYILMSSTKVVPERECRVVFLGESGVGKTNIISRYCTTYYKEAQKKTIASLEKKAISIKDKSILFSDLGHSCTTR